MPYKGLSIFLENARCGSRTWERGRARMEAKLDFQSSLATPGHGRLSRATIVKHARVSRPTNVIVFPESACNFRTSNENEARNH